MAMDLLIPARPRGCIERGYGDLDFSGDNDEPERLTAWQLIGSRSVRKQDSVIGLAQ